MTTNRNRTPRWSAAAAALAALTFAACEDRGDAISTEPPEGAADRGVLADGQTKMSGQREEGPRPATGSGGDGGTRPPGSAAQLPGSVSSMGSTGAGPGATTGGAADAGGATSGGTGTGSGAGAR